MERGRRPPGETATAPDLRTRTAYHEAGHAVMALGLGRTVVHIDMAVEDPSRPDLGHVLQRVPPSLLGPAGRRATLRQAGRQVRIALAGPMAEGRYAAGQAGAAGWRAHVEPEACQTDAEMAGEVAAGVEPRAGVAAYLARAEARVVAAFGDPRVWCQVEALAGHLLGHDFGACGPVPGRVARRVCRDAAAAWDRANPAGSELRQAARQGVDGTETTPESGETRGWNVANPGA
jgi:hypothetical protein